jgi:hypothetical protein
MGRSHAGPVEIEDMATATIPAALLRKMGCSKIDVTAMYTQSED